MQGIVTIDKTRHFSSESCQNMRIMRVGNILRGGREQPERRDAGREYENGGSAPFTCVYEE
jgi:hypothetical protein